MNKFHKATTTVLHIFNLVLIVLLISTSSLESNRCPQINSFSLGKRCNLQGTKSGLYGRWGQDGEIQLYN